MSNAAEQLPLSSSSLSAFSTSASSIASIFTQQSHSSSNNGDHTDIAIVAEKQKTQEAQKRLMLEQKAERIFGYSLSTPKLNLKPNVVWSPMSPAFPHSHTQKHIRKIGDDDDNVYHFPIIMFNAADSPSVLSLTLRRSSDEEGEQGQRQTKDNMMNI